MIMISISQFSHNYDIYLQTFQLSEGDFGQYVKYGIPPKKKLRGFPVTKDALLPSGKYNKNCNSLCKIRKLNVIIVSLSR